MIYDLDKKLLYIIKKQKNDVVLLFFAEKHTYKIYIITMIKITKNYINFDKKY